MSLCNNCGKYGHLFQQCKAPINSYGIVAICPNAATPNFIMIRRKDSFGYIDFIRGKYSPFNIPQLQKIINEMSVHEKERLLNIYSNTTITEPVATEPVTATATATATTPQSNNIEQEFTILWQQLWGHHTDSNIIVPTPTKWTRVTRKTEEEYNAFRKYDTIVNGVYVNKTRITLKDLIESSNTLWTETEWEFPKGRRNNPKEKELECALREFEEETGINKSHLHVIENIMPFEETFIGTNYKPYKHKYFLAYVAQSDIHLNKFQLNEVSKIECVTLEQAMNCMRPYNIEKKTLLQHIYNTITQFTIGES